MCMLCGGVCGVACHHGGPLQACKGDSCFLEEAFKRSRCAGCTGSIEWLFGNLWLVVAINSLGFS